MQRVRIALTTLAVLGAALVLPARAASASGATDAITGGTVTIVVGEDATLHIPTWTTTISGQVAAAGRTYSGTASGSNSEGPTEVQSFTLTGTSATGSLSITCIGGPSSPTPPPLIDDNCSVSIDGAASVDMAMVFAVVPTADLATYKGVYGAAPDAAGLPSLPVSLGTASATDFSGPTGDSLAFGVEGQVTIGGQTYAGVASGSTPYSSGTLVTIDVPSFTLSGTSATGSLTATCSGEFVSLADEGGSPALGVALSVLGCDGSANGGPTGHTTLVGVYRATSWASHFGTTTTYAGVFTGV